MRVPQDEDERNPPDQIVRGARDQPFRARLTRDNAERQSDWAEGSCLISEADILSLGRIGY